MSSANGFHSSPLDLRYHLLAGVITMLAAAEDDLSDGRNGGNNVRCEVVVVEDEVVNVGVEGSGIEGDEATRRVLFDIEEELGEEPEEEEDAEAVEGAMG